MGGAAAYCEWLPAPGSDLKIEPMAHGFSAPSDHDGHHMLHAWTVLRSNRTPGIIVLSTLLLYT
jgi:hypothetical protein